MLQRSSYKTKQGGSGSSQIPIKALLSSGAPSHFSECFYNCFVLLACLKQLIKLSITRVFTTWLLSCVSPRMIKLAVKFIQFLLHKPYIIIESHLAYFIAAASFSFVLGITFTQCQGHITRLWKRDLDEM